MADTIGTAYVQIEPSFEGVTPKIENHFGGEGEKGGKSFASGFGSVIGAVGKATAAAAAVGTAAVAGMVKEAVSGFAEYEQLVGGVETLFGAQYQSIEEFSKNTKIPLEQAGAAWEQYQAREQTVLNNANNAYKTAGLSANEYMETVTSFAAALNASLGDSAWQSANYADMAITDMADNANKMGSSMESIQNAYMGFSKQNFTMLDNLKLGYGGTKEEMQRLLTDAEKLEGLKIGSLDMNNFADVVDAIHIIQENLGIAGTTAKEASSTISGSLATMQASWSNLLTTMGTGDTDAISTAINNLVESASTFGSNVLPVIQQALTGVSQLISQLAPEIAAAIPDLISQVLPGLLTAGVEIIQSLGQGILAAIPTLMPTISQVMMDLANLLISMLPQLLNVGMQIIVELANGISQALPTLMPTIVSVITDLVQMLIDNIPMLIDAAMQLILGLADGLVQALPVLIAKIPEIITGLVNALVAALPQLIQGVIQLVMMLVSHLPEIIVALVEAIPQIIEAVVNGLITAIPQLIAGAIQLVIELVAHLPEIIAALIEAIPQIIEAILSAFGPIVEGLGNLFKNAWEGIKNVFSNVGGWFSEKFSQAKELAGKAWEGVKTYFSNSWEETKNTFANVGSWFSEKFGQAKELASKAWEGIKGKMSESWENIKGAFSAADSWFGDKFGKAKEQTLSAWSNIKEKMSEVWGKIKDAFKFDEALSWGKDMIQNFINGIKQKWEDLKASLASVADTVKSFLGFSEPEVGPLSNFHTYAPDMMDLFAKGIVESKGTVEQALTDVTSDLMKPDLNVNKLQSVQVSAMNSPVGFSDRLERIEMLIREFMANFKQDIYLDTGALVGATAGAYNAALGNISIRSRSR